MTTNAFLFMWDYSGIEAIVPITQYEDQSKLDTWAILKGEKPGANPLSRILTHMKLRAQFNYDRNYEIYAVDCDKEMTEEFWEKEWDERPQETADLIRSKGVKIFSSKTKREVKIK